MKSVRKIAGGGHGNGMPTRRNFIATGVSFGLFMLTGCSSSDTDSRAPSTDGGNAFPVFVNHVYGATEIESAPKRMVVVGFKEQDYFLALNTVPVAIREWFGKKPFATWPWAQDYLGGAEPVVLPRAELDFEQIAALEPDVIVGMSAGMTQNVYEQLSRIAPTVAHPTESAAYSVSWQEMTRTAGLIVGQSSRAEQLVTDLEAQIIQVQQAHPEFEGASMVLASATDGQYFLFGPGATGAMVLATLGLTVPDEVTKLSNTPDEYYVMSPERLDLVDVDLAVWSESSTDDGPGVLLNSPLYTQLDVNEQGRDVFLGLDKYNGALMFSSVLSLPLVLAEVVPALATAIDGNPATRSPLNP